MSRKFKILILTIFLLYGCEYKPIYSNKLDNNFSIEKTIFSEHENQKNQISYRKTNIF